MNKITKVAVCSRSFSKNISLREELLSKYKNVKFNDDGEKFNDESLVKFLLGFHKAIIALEEINDQVLSRLPDLKIISKYGVGLDKIDLNSLKKYGKRLSWLGGVNRRSVSELTLALAITMLRDVHKANKKVLNGLWEQQIGGQLTGKTFGIIGCGFIGKDLVKLLKPFNCNILVYDIETYTDFYDEYRVQPVNLEVLLKKCDVVSLHLPLDSTTRNIISADRMKLLKPNVVIINTARGGLVDEIALKKMLIENPDSSAAFDVFMNEPPSDIELLELNNFLVTPHIGGSSKEAILAMGRSAIDGLDSGFISL